MYKGDLYRLLASTENHGALVHDNFQENKLEKKRELYWYTIGRENPQIFFYLR